MNKFATLEEAFIFYTECQLATAQETMRLKSSSVASIRRHVKIAEDMVHVCFSYGLPVRAFLGCPRLHAIIGLGFVEWARKYGCEFRNDEWRRITDVPEAQEVSSEKS